MLKTEELKELDAHSQALFMWFCLLADSKGQSILSLNQMSELCRVSRNTIISRIEVLIDKGLIIKKNRFRQQSQQSNVYQIKKSILDGDFQITKEVIEEFSEYRKIFPKKRKGVKTGVVYLLKSEELYKIGRTIDFESRFKSYITENPYKVDVMHKVKVADYAGVERHLHELMSIYRVKGEWFNLDNLQVSTVINEMNFISGNEEPVIFH